MMRATTLKASGSQLAKVIGYYAGLAEDQLRRDGRSRGPVDYYVDPHEPPGRWWGGGCEALGLHGDVRPEQLAALLEGRHLGTGRQLGRGFGAKSARAFDLTFSCPKSVSVLWALAPEAWMRDELMGGHDAAVIAALGWAQHIGALTRRGTGGIHQIDTRGVAVAMFRQHTSRTVDPHLHTHGVMPAKVQDLAGNWLSLDARMIKFQQRSIGWVYDAALRAELTARLGIRWGPVIEGSADIADSQPELLALFSQRTDQVEARTAALVARWVGDHDGAEPDARTIAGLERQAVTDSRPAKETAPDPDALRAQWHQRTRAAGLRPPAMPSPQRHLAPVADWDREAVMGEALRRVAAQGSTWLHADVAREIATLVPPEVATSATEMVEIIDRLAGAAMSRCIELHPPTLPSVPLRRDGRPVTEHATDRRVSTEAILAQDARLLSWARRSVGAAPSLTEAHNAQRTAARAAAGADRLVLVIGPAGAGKTTALAMAVAELGRQNRVVAGLAPSGKAADVLATEAGCGATTVAKFLHDVDRPGSVSFQRPPAGATLIVDEAGMCATEDLDRLVTLADDNGWRLVCVGDPAQLPAVGRGGMFEQWCETVPAHHLDDVRRFADSWQGPASLDLRKGKPEAVEAYAAHHCLDTVHPSVVAERVARRHEELTHGGRSLAITCASSSTARKINVAIQHRRNRRRVGPSLDSGTEPACSWATPSPPATTTPGW